MMAFFMVMWIMGMSTDTRKGIASYFNNPMSVLSGEPKSHSIMSMSAAGAGKKGSTHTDKDAEGEQRALDATAQKVKAELAQAKDLKGLGKDVKVTVTAQGLEIELVEARGAVFFESGKAVIRPEARRIIGRLAPILAKSGRAMAIEGHTDAAPCGGFGGNFGLSAARAMALMQELRADGCAEGQFRQVVGYGATHLEKPDHPLDFSNRRVTILIPREAKNGDAPPATALKDRLKAGDAPEALDLRPDPVAVAGQEKAKRN